MIGWQMNDDYVHEDKHPCFRWDSNPRSQGPSDQNQCLRQRSHWDRLSMWCVPCSLLQTDRHFKRVYCCLIRAFILVVMGTWNLTKVSLLSKTLPNICGPRKCIIVSTRTLQCSCSEPLESTPDSVRLMLPSMSGSPKWSLPFWFFN
jgi:hypothetical protein